MAASVPHDAVVASAGNGELEKLDAKEILPRRGKAGSSSTQKMFCAEARKRIGNMSFDRTLPMIPFASKQYPFALFQNAAMSYRMSDTVMFGLEF